MDNYVYAPLQFNLDFNSIITGYNNTVAKINELPGKVEKAFGAAGKAAGNSFNLDPVKEEINSVVKDLESQFANLQKILSSVSAANFSGMESSLTKLNNTVTGISRTLTDYTGKLDALNGTDIGQMAKNVETIMEGMKTSIDASTKEATKNLTEMLGALSSSKDQKAAVATFNSLTSGLKALTQVTWEIPGDKLEAFQKSLASLGSMKVPKGFTSLASAMGEIKNLTAIPAAVQAIGKLNEATAGGKSSVDEFAEAFQKVLNMFQGEGMSQENINQLITNITNLKESFKGFDFSRFTVSLKEISTLTTTEIQNALTALNQFAEGAVKEIPTGTVKVIKVLNELAQAFNQLNVVEDPGKRMVSAMENMSASVEGTINELEQKINSSKWNGDVLAEGLREAETNLRKLDSAAQSFSGAFRELMGGTEIESENASLQELSESVSSIMYALQKANGDNVETVFDKIGTSAKSINNTISKLTITVTELGAAFVQMMGGRGEDFLDGVIKKLYMSDGKMTAQGELIGKIWTGMTGKIQPVANEIREVQGAANETSKDVAAFNKNAEGLMVKVDEVGRKFDTLAGKMNKLTGLENMLGTKDSGMAATIELLKSTMDSMKAIYNGQANEGALKLPDVSEKAQDFVTVFNAFRAASGDMQQLINVTSNITKATDGIEDVGKAFKNVSNVVVDTKGVLMDMIEKFLPELGAKAGGLSIIDAMNDLSSAFSQLVNAANATLDFESPIGAFTEFVTNLNDAFAIMGENMKADAVSAMVKTLTVLSSIASSLKNSGTGAITTQINSLNEAFKQMSPDTITADANAFETMKTALEGLPEKIQAFASAFQMQEGETSVTLMQKLSEAIARLGTSGGSDLQPLLDTLGQLSKSFAQVESVLTGLTQNQGLANFSTLMAGIDVESLTSFTNALGTLMKTEAQQENVGARTASSIQEIKEQLEIAKSTLNTIGKAGGEGTDTTALYTKYEEAIGNVRHAVSGLKSDLQASGLDTSLLDKVTVQVDKLDAISQGTGSGSASGTVGTITKYLNQLSAATPDTIERVTSSLRVMGDMNISNLQAIAETLSAITTPSVQATVSIGEIEKLKTTLNSMGEATNQVKLSAEDIETFKQALQGLAQDASLQTLAQTLTELKALITEVFGTMAKDTSVTNMANMLEAVTKSLQGMTTMRIDGNQLTELADNLTKIGNILSGGLFKLDENNNPIRPYLASLENFDTSKLDSIVEKMGSLATTQGMSGISQKLTGIADAIHSIGVSLNWLDIDSFNDVMRGITKLETSGSNGGTMKLDAEQFQALTAAIRETTSAIQNFTNALAKMTPAQLDNLLENVITLANATGNATGQAAAQMKQQYVEMQGQIANMKNALNGMMKADPATFSLYQNAFYEAANAVDQEDGGYHNLKEEASILNALKQGFLDAEAAEAKYAATQAKVSEASAANKAKEQSVMANTKASNDIALLKEYAAEMKKIGGTNGSAFTDLQSKIQDVMNRVNDWYAKVEKTPEAEKIYGKYVVALEKVNKAYAELNSKQEQANQSTKASNNAELIADLEKRAKAYRTMNSAMLELTRKYGSKEGFTYNIKDVFGTNTVGGMEEPLKRVVTFYKEGMGTIQVTINSVLDEAQNKLVYFFDEATTRQSQFSANGGVQDVVKTYQQLFEVQAKLTTLKGTDAESKELWQNRERELGALIEKYRAANPELIRLAKNTEAYAKAKEKLEATKAKAKDKYNTASEAEQMKAYNDLLKRRYEIQSELQKYQIQYDGTKDGAKQASLQARINTLKEQEAGVQKEIAKAQSHGVSNTQLENEYQRKLNNEKERSLVTGQQIATTSDAVLTRMMQMAKMYLGLRMIRQIWSKAIDYAQEYYDKMNEIQIVTLKTNSQIEAMSQKFLTMANQLHISSTDIADAAVEFVRQGLDEEEVMSRTKWTSIYAKVTNQDFSEAATQVTSSVNAMGISVQDAVDLFVYLGDSSATSGEEVATAMQKASAAAGTFGLDFKHLGAYIAAVSATTRIEASSIGTSFNTIIARWHSIKKNGYITDEDGTVRGSNDITKALSNVGISLFDEDGNWRDMPAVLDEIASKWSGLDSVTKSYIATVMAGTKQQNIFLALMNDMAKGAENGSLVYSLYAGALESSGTVAEKYQVYLESVTAAQDGLTVSAQRLYTALMDGEVLKDFYNGASAFVDALASGAETGVVKVAALVGGLGTAVFLGAKLAAVIKGIITIVTASHMANKLGELTTFLSGGKLMLIVAAIAAVTVGVIALVGAIKDANDESKKLETLNERADTYQSQYNSLKALKDEYVSVVSDVNHTQEELQAVYTKLQNFSPALAIALSRVTGGMEDQEGVTAALNEELANLAGNYRSVRNEANKLTLGQISKQFEQTKDAYEGYAFLTEQDRADKLKTLYESDRGKEFIAYLAGQLEQKGKIFGQDLSANTYKSNTYVWDDIAELLYPDDWYVSQRTNAQNFFADLIDGYLVAKETAGGELDFSQWIVDAFTKGIDGAAKDSALKTVGQTLYDTLFDSVVGADYDTMSIGEQLLTKDLFNFKVNDASVFGDYGQASGQAIVDTMVNVLEAGEDSVKAAGVSLSMAMADGMTQYGWEKAWAEKVTEVANSYGTDEYDTKYDEMVAIANGFSAQYGANFYATVPTKEDFDSAINGAKNLGTTLEEDEDTAETLATRLKDILNDQQTAKLKETLENSNYKEYIDMLKSFINEDGTVNQKGLFEWLNGLDSSILEDFLDMFPEFTQFFADVAEAGEQADASLSTAAEDAVGFADMVAMAGNQLMVALDNYRASKNDVTDEDGKSLLDSFFGLASASGTDYESMNIDDFVERFNTLNASEQTWLMKNSDGMLAFATAYEKYSNALKAGDAEGAAAALQDMRKAVRDLNGEIASSRLDDFADDLEEIMEGGDSAKAVLEVYEKMYTYADNYAEALQEFNDLAGKGLSEINYDDVSKIASALNMTPQAVLQAWGQIPTMLNDYANSGLNAINKLNEQAFFTITGVSDVDFSTLMNSIMIVDNMAASMLDTLIKTGQFEVQTVDVNSVAQVWDDAAQTFVTKSVNGTYKVLKPTNSNPFNTSHRSGSSSSSKSSGGGGGGGSSGSSKSDTKNGNSEESRWVEEIENRIQRISDRMSQLNSIMNSWDSEGYYSAEIKGLNQTNEMLEEQDKILREKIAEAQARLPALIEEFNKTTPDTEAYDDILERVNTIQDAITDWTQSLTDNEASILSNKQKIDDLKDSIRQLNLDLENEVLQAIEDREERIDNMLQARIEMEETILDILKEQAEDAEQAILDAIDAQIDALNDEKDAVADLLDARKEQADEEDKLTQLQQLQAKYARIVADPTRAKDAQDILDEINSLRDEIAWDQAENENDAQQKSLEQQISSLEDYRDYIEQYYEDLVNNPRNFIEQVDAILKMSQEDILAWLQQNSTDYKNVTDASRTDTLNGWTDTLNQMNGVVTTHWAEVQSIIAQGEDAVIAFLKENSAEYREASKLQQEAYVEGWQEMFDKIRKAYQDMQASLLDNSKFINDASWGGSDDTSSSSSSGGGSTKKTSGSGVWAWSLNGKQAGTTTYTSKDAAQKALNESVAYAKQLMEAAYAVYQKSPTDANKKTYEQKKTAYEIQKSAKVAQFAKGGLADYTGLVQIDGTRTNPERILSATQTKLFEGLVSSLEQMSRISVSPMRYSGNVSTGKNSAYTFGDINISVEKLDSDRDLEDLADKVKESIAKSMAKGRAVGGITL